MKSYVQSFLVKKSNIISTIIIVSILIAITGYFYYHHESKMIQQERENDLTAIASLKSKQISEWYQDEMFDSKIISNNVFLVENIENWLTEPFPRNREILKQHISTIISEHDYEDILITTTDGQLLLSSDDQIINTDSVLIRNVKRIINEKILTTVDFYYCSVHHKIHIDFISPVFNAQSVPIAVMVFQISPEKFLFPLIQSWPLPSKSSETMIVRQDGDSVLFLNELRHRTDSALKLRVPLTNNTVTAVQAVLGYQGILRGIDYRGEKVLADIRAISGTPWFMISKIDENELFAELQSKAFFTVLFILLIILFLSAGLAHLYSYQQRNIYRNLFQSQEEFRTTLYSIGDAVITTDKNGNVKHLNPVAEQLTGWREKQAHGKSLEKVFNIINENTRQNMKSPVIQILEKGMVIGLANHTLLISRDKREIPIADSGAPIKDENGDTIGVVLVFRDQTEERKARKVLQESQASLHAVLQSTADGILAVDRENQVLYTNEHFIEMWRIPQEIKDSKEDAILLQHVLDQLENPQDFLQKVQELYKSDVESFDTLYFKDGRIFERLSHPLLRNMELLGRVWSFRDVTERKRMEEALRKSEERYRMMLEQAADAVFLHDETGRILDVNQKACQNLGYTREELLTKSIVDIDPEAIQAGKNEFWSDVIAGKHITFESNHIKKDGSKFPAEITMGAVQLSSGPAILGIVRDVTERRRTEEQIHFQANLLQNVFDAIIASDTEGRIQVWNKAAERIYGWKTKDVVGQKFHDVLQPEYFYQSREKVMASINKDGIWSGEIIHHNKDGKIIPIQSTISSLKDTAGNFTGLVSINHDITEKKQAEEALSESERFLKAIFTSIQDGISVLNPDLTIRYVNNVMNEWYAENLPLEGKKCYEVYHNKDIPCDPCPSLQCMKTGSTELNTVPGLPGSPVEWIELFSFPIKALDSNEVTGVVEFVRNITDRKRTETEKESLETQLRQSQKLESIGTLASGVAHDFNNLLTVIMGHAQMSLMQTDKGDPLHRSLKQIIDSSTRAAGLTRQLLLFSRKEAMEFKSVNLNHTINNLLKMLGRLIGENISIETTLTADVWNVEADEGNIEQVLTNLAVNARDAMPKGGKLFIKTENVHISEAQQRTILNSVAGDYVRISVGDNGEGIPAEICDKIFDPFFSTKAAGKGTGLGLSVVYGIVKKHRGWINVYSEVGKGTRFSIYLPATTISEKSDREADFSMAESLYGNGEHILLIEDEQGVLDLALDALQNYNYFVYTASSGKQAEEVYQKEEGNFDLIFSDVVLPDTNGYELVHLLTRNDPDMSIILSSGYTDEQIRKTIGEDKKILFIQKPYSVNALLELVKKSLKNRTKNLK